LSSAALAGGFFLDIFAQLDAFLFTRDFYFAGLGIALAPGGFTKLIGFLTRATEERSGGKLDESKNRPRARNQSDQKSDDKIVHGSIPFRPLDVAARKYSLQADGDGCKIARANPSFRKFLILRIDRLTRMGLGLTGKIRNLSIRVGSNLHVPEALGGHGRPRFNRVDNLGVALDRNQLAPHQICCGRGAVPARTTTQADSKIRSKTVPKKAADQRGELIIPSKTTNILVFDGRIRKPARHRKLRL